VLRRDGDEDRPLATLGAGSVVGETSVLTGERRSATVRAMTGATVCELGAPQLERLLRAQPQLRRELDSIAGERAAATIARCSPDRARRSPRRRSWQSSRRSAPAPCTSPRATIRS
jgi:CRP-like cAMP-binding protein